MGDKIYKYQLLLGDFVRYEVGSTTSIDIKSGYVIAISRVFYAIIDLDNSSIYIERIKDVEVVSNELNTVVIRSLDANNIKVSRKLGCSSGYICKNLCKGLKDFPDACDKVCPLRKINNLYRTYLPGDKLGNDGVITSASFLSDFSVLNRLINRPVLGGYDAILNVLSGSLPKPDYPLKDRSIDGIKEILNNPIKYNLYERTYYTYFLSKDNTSYVIDIGEVLRHNIINKSYFFFDPKISPCNYCIYDNDTCKGVGCKLKNLNK